MAKRVFLLDRVTDTATAIALFAESLTWIRLGRCV